GWFPALLTQNVGRPSSKRRNRLARPGVAQVVPLHSPRPCRSRYLTKSGGVFVLRDDPWARRLASSTPRDTRRLVACPQMIEAPHAASRHSEIEEHEAVDDSQLTRVQERKEAPRRVRYEISDGHVACQDERDRTCEQAEHDQHPTDELNHAVDARERYGDHPVEGETGKLK